MADPPIHIVFALFPGVTQLDFTGPHQVFSRLPGAEVILASRTGEPIEVDGFMFAGLCVITGGLILVFVYFAAMGLPSTGTTNASMGTPAATRNAFPSPTAVPPSPTVVPSPTVDTYPGQQYIDNAQMASVVNTCTAQPLQTTTIFKINRRIYVTFSIHPDGKNGAVCLFWYLNNRNIAQYPFEVTVGAKAAYSYATYGAPGTANVDIYWASTTACSDKILAQHVNFTVTK